MAAVADSTVASKLAGPASEGGKEPQITRMNLQCASVRRYQKHKENREGDGGAIEGRLKRDDPGAEGKPSSNAEAGPEESGCEYEQPSAFLHAAIRERQQRGFGLLPLTVTRTVSSSSDQCTFAVSVSVYNGGGRPHRLAWPRTRPSQGRNRGSNPLGATRCIENLPAHFQECGEVSFPFGYQTIPVSP